MVKLSTAPRRPLFSRLWVRVGCGVLALITVLVLALAIWIAIEVRSRHLARYPASPADPLPHANIILPFAMKGGHVFIPIRVNGVLVQALVDTGSPVSLVDTAYLAERGIAAEGLGSRVNGQSTAIPIGLDLDVGGQTVASVVATDLTEIRKYLGSPVILGVRGLMDNRVLEVDFPAKTLTLHRRQTFKAPRNTPSLALKARGLFLNRHYGVPVRVGGQQVLAVVDLGADHHLETTSEVASKAGLELHDASRKGVGGVNRDYVTAVVRGTFSLGPYAFRDAPIDVSPPERAGSLRNGPFVAWEANLGTGALRHMHLWIDITGRRLWFSRPPRFIIGLEDSKDGITGVLSSGPAAAAGLKVGDRIALINGAPHLDYWRTRDWTSPAPITLTMDDGRTLTVTPRNVFQ